MRFTLGFLLSIVFLLSVPAQAEIYPARDNTEVIYLDGAEVDLQVRLDLIRQAKVSIDLISFAQAPDQVGRPFLDAIREASQSRCIKVRYLYDGVASYLDWDFLNRSAKRITGDAKCGAEVITLGLLDKWRAGLEWDDFFHEKALIVDGGTPDERIVVGGRGYTRFSTRISDSGYLFRPMNPTRPSVTTDIRTSFDRVWKLALRFTDILPKHAESARPDVMPIPDLAISPDAKKEVARIRVVLSAPPGKLTSVASGVFQPKSVQLFSNDVIEQVEATVPHPSSQARATLKNDAQSALIADIQKFTGRISLTSYAVGFTPEMEGAFIDFIRRGNTLEILTNGKEANARFVPFGLPVYYTTENLTRILGATTALTGKLKVRFLDADLAEGHGRPPFIHRKLVIFDGVEKFIYTGTDNFTWSSAFKNDEWMIRISDSIATEHAKELNAREAVDYLEVSADQVQAMNEARPWLYSLMRSFIFRNY